MDLLSNDLEILPYNPIDDFEALIGSMEWPF
jgi:hypothetical protein